MLPTGKIERRIFLGDGISSLQAAPSGNIWAGYFDEGLFGNEGWLHPNGGVGIVALDDHGTAIYQCTDLRPHNLPSMTDHCRVNVIGDDEAWYLYEHRWRHPWPVIAVHPAGIRHVGDLKEEGYWYFAVGRSLLLTVNVFARPHGLHLFRLPAHSPWARLAECAIQSPEGQLVAGEAYAVRGSMLWVLAGGMIYGIDVDAIGLP